MSNALTSVRKMGMKKLKAKSRIILPKAEELGVYASINEFY